MAKKKINRLNKPYYVTDEYSHSDEMIVIKVNELIGVINHLMETNRQLELLLKNNGVKDRRKK